MALSNRIILLFILLSCFFYLLFLLNQQTMSNNRNPISLAPSIPSLPTAPNIPSSSSIAPVEKDRLIYNESCNIFDGRWVYKPDSKPAYEAMQCPFLEEKMACRRNGREDLAYERWQWEARDCLIPMLNGTDMVEQFKNKRVILVGDSLNRNMWESLACILYSSIPKVTSRAKVRYDRDFLKTYLEVKEKFNFTVEFFWSPFLVELDKTHRSGKKILVLDKLSKNSRLWSGADIMVFNSGHWWVHTGKLKAWDMFKYKGKLVKDMPLELAYKRAMQTWANWVNKSVDPKKTTVMFRSISPSHLSPQHQQWCYTKTMPIMDDSYKPLYPQSLINVIEMVIKSVKKIQVKTLNITKLSGYRIDAHPSIYRFKDWKIRADADMRNLTSMADCSHWCLPGLPDTWNRLLYAHLFFNNTGDVYI